MAQPSTERVGIRRRGNVRSEAARKGWETRRANARARTRAAKKGHQTRRIIGEAQTFLSEGIDQPLVYHNAPSAITEPIRDVDSLEELLDYFENVDGFDDWIDYEAETNAGYEED